MRGGRTPKHPSDYSQPTQLGSVGEEQQVGWLEYTGPGFEFSYTDEARRHERFAPFPAFPKLDQHYRSVGLFPYFAVRLISAADPNYEAVLDAIGLAGRDATPAELLALPRSPSTRHVVGAFAIQLGPRRPP